MTAKLNQAIDKVLSDPFKSLSKGNIMSDDKKNQGPVEGASPIADERVDNVKTVLVGRQPSTYEDTTERTTPSPVYTKNVVPERTEEDAAHDDVDARERGVVEGPNVGGPDADTDASKFDNLAKDEKKDK